MANPTPVPQVQAPVTPAPRTSSITVWIKDTAERSAMTLIQAAVMFFILAQGHNGSGDLKALASAVLPALATVLLNALTVFNPVVSSYYLDVAVRVVRTFLTTTLGAIVADVQFHWFEMNGWKAVAIAGLSAVLVIVKSEIAKRTVGNTITPASLIKAGPTQFAKAA